MKYSEDSSEHQISILCVEDDLDTCEMLAFVLREYEFQSANTIASAIEVVNDHRDDLYILDNWLPDGTGIEICREIRSLYPDAPIIFMSGAVRRRDMEAALDAGANRFLKKPCEPLELKQVVKELIEKSYAAKL